LRQVNLFRQGEKEHFRLLGHPLIVQLLFWAGTLHVVGRLEAL
jgi:hypothetical protein